MASTLFIQMPPKSVADDTVGWQDHAFPFCLASADKRPIQHGRQNFNDLKEFARGANQTVLLVASSDVSFFDVEVPPMPLQKLRAALPNLLEEQLLVDPAELLFVCGNPVNGRCVVAVVSRLWTEALLAAAQVLDARKLSAYPLALSLPQGPDTVSVAIEQVLGTEDQLMLSVKLSPQSTAGLIISLVRTDDASANAATVLSSIELFCRGRNVQMLVESGRLASTQKAIEVSSGDVNIVQVESLDWSHKIAADLPSTLNLFSLLVQENQSSFDWARWRWTVGLTACIVLISVFALNFEWLRLKSEASALNGSLLSTYKTLFPNESSLRDPLLQLQQKIDQSKKLAGQSTEEDFLVMSGQLAQAWQVAHPQGIQLAGLEYKDRSLFVKPKNVSEVQVDNLRSALREHSLKLEIKDGNYKVWRDDGSGK